jgi:hypothetical protein
MERRLEEEETRENGTDEKTILILPLELLAKIFAYFSTLFIAHTLRLVSIKFCHTSQILNLVKHATFRKYEMAKCFVNPRQITKYLTQLDNLRSLVIEGDYLVHQKVFFSICTLKKLEALTVIGRIPVNDLVYSRMISVILLSCKNCKKLISPPIYK